MRMMAHNILYIFLNYFVAYIPFWTIRKLFYILFGMKIGKGSRINMRCVIMAPWRIHIGKNTMINEYVLLDGRGGVTIGNNCSISMWSIVYSASHYLNSSGFEVYKKPIQIGDCCWLGTRCVIMPGSKLNDGSVISVNSVFKGEAETCGVYIGNPATLQRRRELDSMYSLKNKYFFV